MSAMSSPTAQARSRGVRWIALGAFLTVAILVIVLATRPSAESKNQTNPLVGSEAPNVSGTSLTGQSVNLQSMRGRYVVVNFFATWCVPCQKENPELKAFAAEHPGATSPTILAVAYDQNDLNASKSFFAQKGNTWPAVPDNGGRTAVSYGVRGLPESFIVGPDGVIVDQITGGVTKDQLDVVTGQVS